MVVQAKCMPASQSGTPPPATRALLKASNKAKLLGSIAAVMSALMTVASAPGPAAANQS